MYSLQLYTRQGGFARRSDVLSLSIGEPTAAGGIDIAEGVILGYGERRKEAVSLTLIGLRSRLLKQPAGQRVESALSVVVAAFILR